LVLRIGPVYDQTDAAGINVLLWLALMFMIGAVTLGPVMAIAQTTGSSLRSTQPFRAVRSTVEGTFGNVVNYIGTSSAGWRGVDGCGVPCAVKTGKVGFGSALRRGLLRGQRYHPAHRVDVTTGSRL